MSRPLAGAISTRIYAGVLSLIALALLTGGGWLFALGGSPYYLLAGAALAVTGFLVWRGRREGMWLYAGIVVATLGWSIWEVGFSGWGLMPRLVAWLVVGIGFLLPFIRRNLTPFAMLRPALRRVASWPGFAGAVGIAAVLGTAAHALGPVSSDPLFQTGREEPGAVRRILAATDPATAGDWLHYGNDSGGSRFSVLDQLTPANVAGLKPVWTLHFGGPERGPLTSLEVTPLKIGDALYACTGYNDVLSIDAETGHINWRFRSGVDTTATPHGACRGVAYYRVPGATGLCAARIFTNTLDARLIALDAASGRPCPAFGVNGQVSLLTGMGAVKPGFYYVSSAPTLVRGKVVLGGWVSDGQEVGEPSGVIRAFDATTGAFVWAFDMGRPADHRAPEPGNQYTRGTPNSWAPMSADPELGLIYAPTGVATPDLYGTHRRPLDERYANSVVALDADTGDVRWSFQTSHHDVWDYDVASQPTLVDLPAAGGVRRALVQPTKRGEIFLLDRATGRPLSTVEERSAPQTGKAPGERLSPTQPFSVAMPSFRGPDLREPDMWGITPIDQMLCRIQFRNSRYEGPMTPEGLDPAIVAPGYLGGSDWGGVSVDRDRHLMIVNSNRVPNRNWLIPRAEAHPDEGAQQEEERGEVPQRGLPYAAHIGPFMSLLGAPCTAPPYGVLTAVDLVTHKVVWSKPLGTARDSGPIGLASHLPITMGVPNAGGSITTRGGLVFIAATQERTLRALDVTTGRELWSARLPAGGQATPMTYRSPKSGRQFIVVAAGGNKQLLSKPGDTLVAYALPAK
jgi:quinoprotein glucose dehydrogenase